MGGSLACCCPLFRNSKQYESNSQIPQYKKRPSVINNTEEARRNNYPPQKLKQDKKVIELEIETQRTFIKTTTELKAFPRITNEQEKNIQQNMGQVKKMGKSEEYVEIILQNQQNQKQKKLIQKSLQIQLADKLTQKFNQSPEYLKLGDFPVSSWIELFKEQFKKNQDKQLVLQSLEIYNCKIEYENYALFQEIKDYKLEKLKLVWMDKNNIGSKGVKLLIKVQMPSLKRLYMRHCHIQNEGVKHLSKAKWKLNKLCMENNPVTLEGYSAMLVSNSKKLQELFMSSPTNQAICWMNFILLSADETAIWFKIENNLLMVDCEAVLSQRYPDSY